MGKRVEKLKEKLDTLQARLKKEQARERSDERKNDTRRKVLAGAAVLEWAKRDSEFSQRLMGELQGFLARDYDRALFGLPPLPKAENDNTATAA